MTGPEMFEAGLIIEAGFESWRLDHFPDATGARLAELRDCFFAGGLHASTMLLFSDPNATMAEITAWSRAKLLRERLQ